MTLQILCHQWVRLLTVKIIYVPFQVTHWQSGVGPSGLSCLGELQHLLHLVFLFHLQHRCHCYRALHQNRSPTLACYIQYKQNNFALDHFCLDSWFHNLNSFFDHPCKHKKWALLFGSDELYDVACGASFWFLLHICYPRADPVATVV